MNFHCLFEQSGTFKNVFKENGHNAFDYDILNYYQETDIIINIFDEIEKEYENILNPGLNKITIFSKMNSENDFVFAFYPCTHFADANQLIYKLYNAGKKIDFNIKNTNKLIIRNRERAYFFEIYIKFLQILEFKKIPGVIENPASSGKNNYLNLFSPIQTKYYEKNRMLFGDNFQKPTNFFYINFEMKENFLMYDKNIDKKIIHKTKQNKRSEITKIYAQNFYNRFLKEFLK